MRRLIVASLLCVLSYSFCLAQVETNIVLPKSELTIREVLSYLEEAYELQFAYNDDAIGFDKRIIFNKLELPLEEVISKICKISNLSSEQIGNSFYFKANKPRTKKKFTISGRVLDEKSGEALIGAHVQVEGTSIGGSSNNYGFFSITLPEGNYKIQSSFTGFETLSLEISLKSNVKANFLLNESVSKLDEVVITGTEPDQNIINPIPGVNTLNFKSEGDIPYFLGEVDVLQGSLLLPGINNLGEDANGINVRGGSADQNLILLDEATIYNTSHFYGLISVFNPESVNDVEILKGGIPPKYGGRNSSVVNIWQKEGNDKEYHLAGGIGLVSARLTLEGPIKKEKSSFLISGRRSILNLALRTTDFDNLGNNKANFEDFNFKVNFRPNDRNRFYLSGYYGNDRNETGLETFRRWGNRTLSARWNHIFNPKLFANFSFIVSQYSYKVTDLREAGSFFGESRIINYDSKVDLSYYATPTQRFDFGGAFGLIRLNPGDRLPLPTSGATNPVELDSEHAYDPYLYASHHLKINKLQLLYGLRFSSLFNIGGGDVYVYEGPIKSRETIVDTITYESLDVIQTYYGLEPRISVNYQFDDQTALKASYTRNYQYLHLISNTITPSPTDIWKISDTYIEPTRSDQYSIGLYKNFFNNKIESYIDFYYRDFDNVLEYKPNADLLLNETIETEVLTGVGRSYGAELMIKKNYGDLKGWISYSLSRTERQVKDELPELSLNQGEYFPTDYDQTHQFSATGIYSISKRWSGSANFIYATGRPVTLPSDKYEFNGTIIPHFTERNQDRLPDYHRLDISFKLEGKKIRRNGEPKKVSGYWTFSVYNLYARKNAFSYIFRESEVNPGQTEIIEYSILPSAIPAVTYNFRL